MYPTQNFILKHGNRMTYSFNKGKQKRREYGSRDSCNEETRFVIVMTS